MRVHAFVFFCCCVCVCVGNCARWGSALRRRSLSPMRQVTDAGIEQLAAGCPNLNHLDLWGCAEATDAGIERLAAGCPNLSYLELWGMRGGEDAGLSQLAAGCNVRP